MQTPEQSSQIEGTEPISVNESVDQRIKAIAYSLDALIPGFYLWCGPLKLRFGGSTPEENYPGTIHQPVGLAVVLPGYRIYSTYQDSYDPR